MSVVAAAAVGPAGGAAYGAGPQLCDREARKRKDVVQDQEAISRRGDDDEAFLARAARKQFVLERVEEERSSIGAASEEDDREEEGEEADSSGDAVATTMSRRKQDALECMDALDDALPIKRGLSNFFSGKSRSFASLQDAAVSSARDLAKPENPFNKRRRVLRCSSIRRVASTSLTALPPFLPPAGNNNDDDDDGGSG